MDRSFYALLSANVLSSIGGAFSGFVLILWIYDNAQPAGPAISVLMLAEMIPAILLGAAAGAWADRFSRKKIVVFGTIVRIALVLCLLWAVYSTFVIAVLAAVFALACVDTIVGISKRSWLPMLVDRKSIQRANGLWEVIGQVGFIVAPVIAALLYVHSTQRL